MDLYKLTAVALEAALNASEAVFEVYNRAFVVANKSDGSPITEADRNANQVITGFLEKTGIPIISEESSVVDYNERKHWLHFWVVDPLDGTREFVDRNGEFTVNIALVQNESPVVGVIVAPVLAQAWYGIVGEGVFKIDDISRISGSRNIHAHARPIVPGPKSEVVRMGVSRSHLDAQTIQFIRQIQETGQPIQTIAKGSSLKFCMLAEGLLDVYARYAQIHEWDIAAGHAIVRAGGGELFHISQHATLLYNRPILKTPGFVAFSDRCDASPFFDKFSF